jgi:hypothetical protein
VAYLYREFSGTMMEAKGLILRELVEAVGCKYPVTGEPSG